jgi:hypothetical protein
MSILDKHQAPWTFAEPRDDSPEDTNTGSIVSARGRVVAWAESIPSGRDAGMAFSDEQAKRLILAAPVLLECVKTFVFEDEPRDMTPFNILLDDIEGTNTCDPIITEPSLSAFLSWLRKRGPAPKSKAERERDELLAALKSLTRFVPNTGGPGAFGEARRAYVEAKALIKQIEENT